MFLVWPAHWLGKRCDLKQKMVRFMKKSHQLELKMGVIEQNIAHNHARLTITILTCTAYTVIAAFPHAPLSLQVI